MKVEKQGRYECMLATMAALKGIPLKIVRARACQIACIEKWSILYTSKDFDHCLKIYRYTIEKLGEEMNIPRDILISKTEELSGTVLSPSLPPNKKGVIRFQYESLDHTFSFHACPFENERIYDPGIRLDELREYGMTLEDYLAYEQRRNDVKLEVLNIGVLEE